MSDLSKRIADLSPELRARLEDLLLERVAAGAAGNAIPRRVDRGPAPLSFAQQRLWFLEQLEPGSAVYHIGHALRLRGELHVEALQRALDGIVARHEALRTRFVAKDGFPVQVIAEPQTVPLTILELTPPAADDREAALQRILTTEVQRPFDLTRDLLFRATLIRLAAAEHVLLLVVHHIAADGWSLEILFRELASLYEAAKTGCPSALSALPLQYADYAVWQRQWLQGEVLEASLAYWRRQLADLMPLELPTDRPRPVRHSSRGNSLRFVVSAELTDKLRELARMEGATLYMLLLAAFLTLLSRYTGQDDLAVGTPVANRDRMEIEPLIGFFVNTLVMRGDLSGNPSFRELLQRVRGVALDAFDHQDLPFETLVEMLRPERHLNRNPLFQTLFQLLAAADSPPTLPGVQVDRLPIASASVRFDLELHMREARAGLNATMVYSSDIFEARTIERMLGHFHTLLEGIVKGPDTPIASLPLLPQAERHLVLVEWNNTATAYPQDASIPALFEAQAARTPDAVALVWADQQMTYGELNRQANRLAHSLQRLGVGLETRVGICLERSPALVVGLLGILKAGGAYVPLDPRDPPGRLAFLLADCQAPVLLTQAGLLAEAPAPGVQVVCLDRAGAALAQESPANPTSGVTAEHLAYVTYTSGSTGTPKGVEVPHRGVIRLLCGVDYVTLDASQTLLHLSPLAFDASTFELWGALLHGARCVLFPDPVPTVAALGEALARHQVSTLWLTAALFNVVVDEAPAVLRGVRQLLIGGEALSVDHVRRALAQLPGTTLLNGYGPTEGTTFTCCYRIPRTLDPALPSIPIGRPIANTEAYVLDAAGQLVPCGVPGELWIGGAGLARGYLHRPDLTAEAFLPHPFRNEPGARLYRTGDRVRWRPDGVLEFLGRRDDQVKLRGFRVELGEVEAALRRHPQVRDAVVVVWADGRGERRLVAYVVPGPGTPPADPALRRFLGDRLPDYMIPSTVVVLPALPRTPSGKVDRQALPPPAPPPAEAAPAAVAPRTPVEIALARIWADLLGLDRVGLHDDFFALGGHSLLAVRLFARIETELGRRLPLASLFQGATIKHLAALLEDQSDANRGSVVEIRAGDSGYPLFLITDMMGELLSWKSLIQYLDTQRPIYGFQLPEGEGAPEAPFDLKAMAAHCVECIGTVQPDGPVYLAAYSIGGRMALEIAQQLVRKGREVAFLGMIDAGPSSRRQHPLWKLLRTTPYFLRNLPYWLVDDLLQTSPSEMRRRIRRKLRAIGKRIVRLCTPGVHTPVDPDFEDVFDVDHLPDRYRRVMEAQYRAWKAYVAAPYPGRVTLLRARTHPLLHSLEPDMGWGKVACGGVEMLVIPGHHRSIMEEPLIQKVAEALKACLDRADQARCIRPVPSLISRGG